MPLSCSCDYDYDLEPGMWMYYPDGKTPHDFMNFSSSRRKRCCSCGRLIDIGAVCVRHPRYRYPHTEVEARINGADWDLCEEPTIRMADHIQCERCGEIYFNLFELGFECLMPNEDMEKALEEYKELYL